MLRKLSRKKLELISQRGKMLEAFEPTSSPFCFQLFVLTQRPDGSLRKSAKFTSYKYLQDNHIIYAYAD